MTFYEKLIQEFGAAIKATLGSKADEPFNNDELTESDIREIARKTAFYLDK